MWFNSSTYCLEQHEIFDGVVWVGGWACFEVQAAGDEAGGEVLPVLGPRLWKSGSREAVIRV